MLVCPDYSSSTSSRASCPGSNHPQALELAAWWIPVTSTGMTDGVCCSGISVAPAMREDAPIALAGRNWGWGCSDEPQSSAAPLHLFHHALPDAPIPLGGAIR